MIFPANQETLVEMMSFWKRTFPDPGDQGQETSTSNIVNPSAKVSAKVNLCLLLRIVNQNSSFMQS